MKNHNTVVSYERPIWKVLLLHVITYGIYDLYWFYSNWKQLSETNSMKIRPWLRTLGLFVPFLSAYFVWGQLDDIRKFCEEEKIPSYPTSIGFVLFYFLLISGCGLTKNTDFVFIVILSVLPLLFVQDALNLYWDQMQPDKKSK